MRTLIMMLTLTTPVLAAGPAPRHDGAQLLNELRKLQVLGTALYVAAHPDDENTRLLASLANEALYRAAYLSFTRGEGGQNLIGPELGPGLGVIRTQELLAARRVDGAEQYFTRARDFGFSKSVDETLAIWDHDRVLADAVWVIRTLRPDVIITRFPLEAGETHGHHTASARLALEAFKAAADPAFHPEQLEQVSVWQAKRIVWNAWNPDPNEKLPEGGVKWDSSLYSPLLGLSYGELAAESRSMHKSQGFGAAPVHGPSPEYFVPLAGEAAKASLFEGIDSTWKRVPGAEKLATLLARAVADYRVTEPSASIPVLLLALEELRKLPANPWKARKEADLVDALADCAGLFVEATAPSFRAVQGGKLEVTTTVLNRSTVAITLDGVKVLGSALSAAAALERGRPNTQKLTVDVAADLPISTPYWLAQEPAKGGWTMPEHAPLGLPEQPSPFDVEFRFTLGTQKLSLHRAVAFKWTDPTVGERFRPIEVLPPVVVKPSTPLLAFTDLGARTVKVTVTANADDQHGQVHLDAPEGFTIEPASAPFTLAKTGAEAEVSFSIKAKPTAPTNATFTAVATIGASSYSRGLTRIEYPHIPMQTVLPTAQVKVMRVDLKRGKTTRVGYIAGAGDDVPGALRQVGYEVTMLSDEALTSEPLGRFDAIVVGIRAYNVNPRLPSVYARLMQYVKDGGTLVAQYNTRNWLSNVPAAIGPFPFEISQERVTDEDAEVTMTPHAVLQSPNAMTAADFTGWVQERGLYFAAKYDQAYETPLSMHDPNAPAAKGSLLVAKVGKGRFVYTGLAFFRQLPAGVPGAYRLFANLIDHG
jgi:LmbE family N-acetylglucosaminyl deacetylase